MNYQSPTVGCNAYSVAVLCYSGIGAAIALSLARDGAKIVVNYNADKKSADAVVAAITSVAGGAAIAVQADVSKSDDVGRLFAEAKKAYGRIDIVVANSGVGAAATPIAATTNEQFDRMYNATFIMLHPMNHAMLCMYVI